MIWIQADSGAILNAEAFDVFRAGGIEGGRSWHLIACKEELAGRVEVIIAEGAEDEIRARLAEIAQRLNPPPIPLHKLVETVASPTILDPPHDDPDAGHRAD